MSGIFTKFNKKLLKITYLVSLKEMDGAIEFLKAIFLNNMK